MWKREKDLDAAGITEEEERDKSRLEEEERRNREAMVSLFEVVVFLSLFFFDFFDFFLKERIFNKVQQHQEHQEHQYLLHQSGFQRLQKFRFL